LRRQKRSGANYYTFVFGPEWVESIFARVSLQMRVKRTTAHEIETTRHIVQCRIWNVMIMHERQAAVFARDDEETRDEEKLFARSLERNQ
jgi:hypothetical protein